MASDVAVSAKLKAQAAVEALAGGRSITEIASAYGVSSQQVEAWRDHVIAHSPHLFADASGAEPPISAYLGQVIAEHLTQGLAVMDKDGYCTYTNPKWREMMGYSEDELASMPLHYLVHHHHPDGSIYPIEDCPLYRAAIQGKVLSSYKDTFFRKDGSAFPVCYAATPVYEHGVLVATVVEVQDMTKQEEVEQALHHSEVQARDAARIAEEERAKIDALLEATPVAMTVADHNGKLVRVNAANEKLWGYTPPTESVDDYGQWQGWWADGSPRDGRPVLIQEWPMSRAVRGEESRHEIITIQPFGSSRRKTLAISAAPVRNAQGEILGGVVAQVDITDLVDAKEAERRSAALFHALANNLPQLIWMADPTGNIFWFNRRCTEYTGIPKEELVGMGWQKAHHPEHVERTTAGYLACIQNGIAWEDTFPVRGANGKYRWFLSRALPVRNEAGVIAHWVGTNTDVSEQREAQEVLRESEQRKDHFIAVLAHELRNPLAPIQTALDIFDQMLPEHPVLNRARQAMDRQIGHMSRLIDDLLDVSRIARGKVRLRYELCDLILIATQAAEDYRQQFESNEVSLNLQVPSVPIWVRGDRTRLAQCLSNLLHNCTKFTRHGDQVTLSVMQEGSSQEGLMAVVAVQDSGMGIAPEMLEHLFAPFAQGPQDISREKGGLGLGLSLIKGLVELHGGQVTVQSAGLDQGATFTLRIPMLAGQDVALAPDSAATVAAGSALKLLLIDDNTDLVETLSLALSMQGHTVITATNGQDGLDKARQARPDVVLCDIGLPWGMSGFDVAQALRRDPNCSKSVIVAMSGYGTEGAKERAQAAGFDLHLTKPVKVNELNALFQRLVPGKSSSN